MAKEKNAIVLFSGCGGDALALKRSGFKILGFVENERHAKRSFKMNFTGAKLIGEEHKGDIRKIPDEKFEKFRGKVDIITAGFPCQGFSHAGKKNPNDPRNDLFWEFVRAVKIIEPEWIIGENVFGLLHRKTDDGKAYISEVIVSAFEDVGYNMSEPKLLEARQFGVPQKRKRAFFIGRKNGPSLDTNKLENIKKKNIPIKDIVEFSLEGAIPFDPKTVEGKIIEYCESSGNEEPSGKPHPYLVSSLNKGKLSFGKRNSPHHTEIVNLNCPMKTVHCGYEFQPRLFVPLKNKNGTFLRTFTVKELAQIQGFPKNFKLSGSEREKINQIGNAVPPQMIEGIIEEIQKFKPVGDFVR